MVNSLHCKIYLGNISDRNINFVHGTRNIETQIKKYIYFEFLAEIKIAAMFSYYLYVVSLFVYLEMADYLEVFRDLSLMSDSLIR